jgi:hypothetical protein
VNALELRYQILRPLIGTGRSARILSAELIGPSAAEPGMLIEVVTDASGEKGAAADATRRYRVTIEEITEPAEENA